ncbi:methionyl-tRNA formyltransferase [Coxiella endosymbiont of Amblyomma sculptum]|uniref:methionyl-tRNA formyltransferase n=1 Tax=Coxiella endosymbiont of Amblyomma sculptum TaxID=2487929 RepID=UPI00132E8E50|nr:methionyl-tRNA formyltransferase [Coxiella endosymbiont of Amblyomma sculptum]QHG92388.1 methionyl-tRNA formyltransferase [Coxiella endosymbiont of Amblyomma sculptum]
MSLNIVFAGTSLFSVPILQALIESRKHRIVAVCTQPDRPAGRGRRTIQNPVRDFLAASQKINIFQPILFKEEEEREIRNLKADIMIVAAYGLFLPNKILSAYRFGCVNIHASLLPRWRGASPIQHTILSGDQKSGITIVQMDERLDAGDILAQKSTFIKKEDTTGTLCKRLATLGSRLLMNILDRIESGTTVRIIKQNTNRVTYAPKIQKKDAEIDWNDSAINLERQVRAFNPHPIAFTYFKNQPLRIWKAEALLEKALLEPGNIIRLHRKGLDVATGDGGILRIHQLQFPGKRTQIAWDFINAYWKELHPGQTVLG